MSADVYIGGEPYEALDDVRALRHLPCGEVLFGDNTIAAHICWFNQPDKLATFLLRMSDAGCDDIVAVAQKPWHYNEEAREAGVA